MLKSAVKFSIPTNDVLVITRYCTFNNSFPKHVADIRQGIVGVELNTGKCLH